MAAREILDGRFTVDGQEVPGEWSAAQLDGYGAWVWALGGHVRRHGVDPAPWLPAARLSLRYAADCWQTPCFDWWEERRGVHVATLAALYGGLTSGLVEEDWAMEAADSVRSGVLREGVTHRRLAARLGEGGLDASVIAVATPFGLLEPDDPLMMNTVRTVESELMVGGGVHRHPDDEFYGGGLWVILAGFLGWHYARVGRVEEARAELDWIAAAASGAGELPEQPRSTCCIPGSAPNGWTVGAAGPARSCGRMRCFWRWRSSSRPEPGERSVSETKECAIVGGGLAGLVGYATLRHRGLTPAEIDVFGTDADPAASGGNGRPPSASAACALRATGTALHARSPDSLSGRPSGTRARSRSSRAGSTGTTRPSGSSRPCRGGPCRK
jgi:hypothetical protein